MTQEEIRAILSLADNHQNGGCGPINELFDEHISHVDERIAELTQLKTQLTELRQRCLSARPDAEDCGILHGERDAGRGAAGAAHAPGLTVHSAARPAQCQDFPDCPWAARGFP